MVYNMIKINLFYLSKLILIKKVKSVMQKFKRIWHTFILHCTLFYYLIFEPKGCKSMKQRYFSLYHNIEILQHIANNNSKINCNTLIMALIIPSSASWCDCNTNNNRRNIIHIDKQYVNKYTTALNITERVFKESLRQLITLDIIKKDNKNKKDYFVNPWWATAGDDDAVQEFRAWCIDNDIFKPPTVKNLQDEAEYIDRLTKAIDSVPSMERHTCVYLSLDNVDRFLAFTSSNRKKLNSIDIILFIYFMVMCKFTKSAKKIENCNTIEVAREDQRNIRDHFGMPERTVRDSLIRLQQFRLIHKIKTSVYMINPCISAKGTGDKVDKLQSYITNIDTDYFGVCANGDLEKIKDNENNTITYTSKTTGEIIRQVKNDSATLL